jgi:RimJ/RimL family protein N-acetyltransferase
LWKEPDFIMDYTNELGQPVGFPVAGWRERPRPPRTALTGRYCAVEPLQPEVHAADLYEAYLEDKAHRVWTYLPYGPFQTREDYREWLESYGTGNDPLFHAVIDLKTSQAAGVASYLNIKPDVGVIEVGHINYAPQLQRTAAATEAMFLMMRRAFDELGYRRYEWKCDDLNAASRRAAERLGFVFEGVFRQATIYKGRNRDTAWYSIIDAQWPALKKTFERWLEPGNFDSQGRQRLRLSDVIHPKI